MGRYKVYQKYKHYTRDTDDSTMDELCNNHNNAFELQVQQKFLRDYMTDNKDLNSLLLYHAIGSGKSCSAIVMSEAFLSMNPNNRITFILPARLRTNMYDELFTACSGFKYVSEEDYATYIDPSTSNYAKSRIKSKFMSKIAENYSVLSFEKFRMESMKNKNDIKTYFKNFTKNNMIIVDEAHNLFTSDYDVENYEKYEKSGTIDKTTKGINAILMKLLSKFCHPSCKMIFMTATPVFDNIDQLKELANIVKPTANNAVNEMGIKEVIQHLRGKISYFPGTSPNAYPTYEYKIHNIPVSEEQDLAIHSLQEEEGGGNPYLSDPFLAQQRMFSVSTLSNDDFDDDFDIRMFEETSPKIYFLLKFIKENVGKHVVYSNFIEYGVKVLEKALRIQGWKSLNEVKNDPELWKSHKNKVFATWDGRTNDAEKQFIKSVANNSDNIFGNKVKVIIGSPSIREGVTVKHAQHIHILDPLWNMSAKLQVEGRAIRFCSHSDIDEKRDKPLKRHVEIHTYNLIPREDGLVTVTSDQLIANIMDRKHKMVTAAESAMQKVAIDYHLFKKLYSKKKYNSSPVNPGSADSDVSFEENIRDIAIKGKRNRAKDKNTCPSKRRPDSLGNCPENQYKKLNAQKKECCYKYTKKQLRERNL